MNLPFADAAAPTDVTPMTSFQHAVFAEGLRQIADRVETKLKVQIEERDEQNRTTLLRAVNALSAADAARMRQQIDFYQEATIEALQRNEDALHVAQRDVETMLGQAHVLPDGRRVFKSENGKDVYDEHGQLLSPDEIDPDSISNARPSFEDYAERLERRNRLAEQREELFTFQNKLDAFENGLNNATLTPEDLAEFEALIASPPPALVVDTHISRLETRRTSQGSVPANTHHQGGLDQNDLDELSLLLN